MHEDAIHNLALNSINIFYKIVLFLIITAGKLFIIPLKLKQPTGCRAVECSDRRRQDDKHGVSSLCMIYRFNYNTNNKILHALFNRTQKLSGMHFHASGEV